MNFIYLDTRTIQQLIQHNKVQIRELDTNRKYLEHLVQLYWNSCNPIEPNSILSNTAFKCLNEAKADIKEIKKKIKMLAALQYSLKYSLR